MHTIKIEAAEAVTIDGQRWDIYVADDALLTAEDRALRTQVGETATGPSLVTGRTSEASRAPDSARGPRLGNCSRRCSTSCIPAVVDPFGESAIATSVSRGPRLDPFGDIRYGSWSMDTGLRRGPINPSAGFRHLEALGDVVFEQLRARHREVPFPFRDTFELWLLDTAGRPLALLHSVVDECEMTFNHSPQWRAGFAAHDRFASPAATALGAANAGDYLTRYVNDHAGAQPQAQWFRREASGEGHGLAPRDGAGRTLAAREFPPLFLANVGHDAAHRQLIEDFLAWQAAWLLVCPCLDADTRRKLERCARLQAVVVERQYRLYPQLIDEDAIKAALVEAILRRSQPPAVHREELLPVHYLEFTPYDNE